MSVAMSVFDPTAPESSAPLQTRRVLDGLKVKVVGFIDNTKPNFHYLVEDLSRMMLDRYGVKSVLKRSKGKVSIPAPEELISDLAVECDLVITGSGD